MHAVDREIANEAFQRGKSRPSGRARYNFASRFDSECQLRMYLHKWASASASNRPGMMHALLECRLRLH